MQKSETPAFKPTSEFDLKYGENRKKVAESSGIFDKLLPTDVNDPNNGLETAAGYLEDGRGLVVIMNHPTAGDHLRVGRIIFSKDVIRNAPVSVAVAHHQFSRLTERFMDYLGIDAKPVVTESTVAKGKNKLHPMQKVDAIIEYAKSRTSRDNDASPDQKSIRDVWGEFQKPLAEGHGGRDYAKKAGAILNEGGIVVLGPQGTRNKTMEMWDKRPVRFLLTAVDQRKHLGVVFLGIDERGGGSKINLGRTYGITIGETLTYEELQVFAEEEGLTIDEAVYVKLNETVAEAKTVSKIPLEMGKFAKIKSWLSQKSSVILEQS